MNLSKLFIFAFLILTLAGVQMTRAQVKGKPVKKKAVAPRTVTDFYMRLPVEFFPYLEYDPKNRASLLGTTDVSKGYLGFDNNRPIQPRNGQILLLKRMSGVPMLAISYTDCDSDPCRDSLRFVEYENGRWTEADAAPPPLDRQKTIEIYRKKTGKNPDEKSCIVYEISPSDRSISVQLAAYTEHTEIYKLEWDGNIYDFAAGN